MVSRLKRTRYGNVFIPPKVKQGQWVEMDRKEIKGLYRLAGMDAKPVASASREDKERMERQFKKRARPPRSR